MEEGLVPQLELGG